MIVQQFAIIKQVSHYSTKRHSLEPMENDTVPQKAQCTHCLGAAGRQVQKCHNTNKLSPGDICCSHASKLNSSLKVLHRKWCWGANSQHFSTQSIPSDSTQKSGEKVTEFELTLPKTNKKKHVVFVDRCVTLLENREATEQQTLHFWSYFRFRLYLESKRVC